jgi:hypothetical protein
MHDEADQCAEGPVIEQQSCLPIPKRGERDETEHRARDGGPAPPPWEGWQANRDRTCQCGNTSDHVKHNHQSCQLRIADAIAQEPGAALPSFDRCRLRS